MPPKEKGRSGTVKRSLAPNLRKRAKTREDPGTVTIQLGLSSNAPGDPNPSHQAPPTRQQRIPVVVAPDEEWRWKQPADEAISSRSSPELDLTQPAEPDHLVSELLPIFLSEDLSGISLQSIDDEVVHSILEEVAVGGWFSFFS